MLLDLLLPFPQHEKLKQEINEMIDIPFIEQQAKNEALDFLVCLNYSFYVKIVLLSPPMLFILISLQVC